MHRSIGFSLVLVLAGGPVAADPNAGSVTASPAVAPAPQAGWTEIVYTEPPAYEPTFAEPALGSSLLLDPPSIPRRTSLARRVVDNLTVIGDELGLHVYRYIFLAAEEPDVMR